MAETQEGSATRVGDSSQKLHADIGQVFLDRWKHIDGVSALYRTSDEVFTDEERREAFTKTAAISKQYTDALIERWIKEIDTYLVYAGLFSAILTAFNVESYQLLQPASPDPSPAILQHISLQLSSLSYVPPFINSTHPPFSSSGASATTPSVVPTWAVWLNVFWFSGLVLSLSAASIGILVKQWINEFQSGLSGDSEHIARLRQYRLNNFKSCRVGFIVNMIPVLLQGALALFLAGLLALLWRLHRAVAAVTSLFVMAIAVFIVGTTIAPLLTERCAYLSPQSLMVYDLWPYVPHLTCKILSATKTWLFRTCAKARALSGLPSTTTNRVPTEPSVDTEPPHQSWVAREHGIVRDQLRDLEMDMYCTTYEATLDSDVIFSATARIVDWDPRSIFQWLGRLVEIDTFHFGKLQDHDADSDQVPRATILYGHILLCAIIKEGSTDPAFPREEIEERFLSHVPRLEYCNPAPSDMSRYSWLARVAWILSTHEALALHAAEAEGSPHDQSPSPSHIGKERWHNKEIESVRLDSMARIVDTSEFPTPYGYLLFNNMRTHVTFAFRTLQTCGYALDKPFEHLGAYLRAHALLLHSAAIGSFLILSEISCVDMQNALSDISATLDNLSRNIPNDAPTDSEGVKEDIIRPLSHIVHVLSHRLDLFQPLLPPGFCDGLESFSSAFKQSKLYDNQYYVWVPWDESLWYPSDLYDDAQALITKVRTSAGQIDKRHKMQSVPKRSQTHSNPPDASASSAPRHEEGTTEPSDPNTANVIMTSPSTQSHPGAESGRRSPESHQVDPWMYYYGDDFPEI